MISWRAGKRWAAANVIMAALGCVIGVTGEVAQAERDCTLRATVLLGTLAGQPDDPTHAPGPVSEQRLKFLTDRFAEYHLFRGEDRSAPLTPTTEPILRYSNPVREIGLSDGVIYLWLYGARPAAAACLSVRRGGAVHRELTFLEHGPLACVVEDQTIWSPTEGGLKWETLNSVQPAGMKSLRLVQMRSIARRFAATCYKPKTQEAFDLRVLAQPIYRYEEEASGTIDGAVFAIAQSNDPEILLLLEAVTGAEGGRSWRYGLARMSSVPMTVQLDGREVWSAPFYWGGPRSPSDPYLEAPDGKTWIDAEETK
jgi:hypothetical protein